MKLPATQLLILNEGGAPPSSAVEAIQNLTTNVLPKTVRHDTMEGRDFIVVPMVILTEGVHNGSGGPLYYPPAELSKTPAVWDHKPVVVYHPEINGQGVSACSPTIISSRKVGVMMNTRYEKGKLRSEAWLEKDRADLIDPRIMAAVENNEMMELSTGVFVDNDTTEGEWKGEAYTGIARNYRPDHLAILPDKVGACSIKDGAGFLRNEKAGSKLHPVAALLQRLAQQMGFASNSLSFSNVTDQLRAAVREKLGIKDNTPNGPYCYVCDVYPDFFIYEYDNVLYRLGYSATDTGVTLSEEAPKTVVRVTEYRTVAGAFVGNQDQNTPQAMNKQKIVDAIIAAAVVGGWSETDRPQLMALNEAQLARIQGTATPPVATPATNAAAAPAPVPAPAIVVMPAPAPAPVAAVVPAVPSKIVSMQDYLDAAPAAIRETLTNGLAVMNEEKTKLIAGILANKSHSFTQADLDNKPLGELRNLAALAGVNNVPAGNTSPRVPNYGGQAHVPATNAESEEVMAVPTMNFETAAPAAK